MKARRSIAVSSSLGGLLLALLLASTAAAGRSPAGGWITYITPDGEFHATRDPATVPPEAAPLRPAATPSRQDGGELCHTVERLDRRGLGYWARQGVLRVQTDEEARSCLGGSAPDIARAMAQHCRLHGTGGYQAWSDLVSRALRVCEG